MEELKLDQMLAQITRHSLDLAVPTKPETVVVRFTADGSLEPVATKPIEQSVVATYKATPTVAAEVGSVSIKPYVLDAIKKYPVRSRTIGAELDARSLASLILEYIGVSDGRVVNLEKLRSLRIIDLGCGGEHPEGTQEENYYPWVCRVLHLMGANITGVDKRYPRYKEGRGEKEDWDFKCLDLTAPGALNCFENNSADVINMNYFLGEDSILEVSPSLGSYYYTGSFEHHSYKEIEARIAQECLRILKLGGLLIVNETVYKKVGGPLIFKFEAIQFRNPTKRFERYQYIDGSYLS